MDASEARSKTLEKLVSIAGARDMVSLLAGQDFLAVDPLNQRFRSVTRLLLDPSCSGSGIIGRDDVPTFVLPNPAATNGVKSGKANNAYNPKKRKFKPQTEDLSSSSSSEEEEELHVSRGRDQIHRLMKLSNLQTRIVQHAMRFPSATRITYSTCSIHSIENEQVVARVLASDITKQRGWRIMRRDEQPDGLARWKYRGAHRGDEVSPLQLSDEELDACLRCWPGEEGLGGFFVVGFIRDEDAGEEQWEGFSD